MKREIGEKRYRKGRGGGGVEGRREERKGKEEREGTRKDERRTRERKKEKMKEERRKRRNLDVNSIGDLNSIIQNAVHELAVVLHDRALASGKCYGFRPPAFCKNVPKK